MIKALFFDIDGTLVSIDSHRIPQSTVDALKVAHENGVKIFISTGRPPVIMDNIRQIQCLDIIDGYVAMNGCYCLVGDETVYADPIPRGEVDEMVRLCDEGGYSCILVGINDIATYHPDEAIDRIFYGQLNVRPIESREYDEVDYEIYQISPFFGKDVEDRELYRFPNCEFNRWHPEFADVNAKGNTKQNGIDAVLKYLGMDKGEIMAFGDGGNDIGMLAMAGIGVAMGNAADDVKAVADYVTSSVDEDGIARALEHFGVI